MKILIDSDLCIGSGACEDIRPDIFEIGDDGIVRLLKEDFIDADRQDLEEAVCLCPTQALRIEE
jgi:ferredoxin